MERNSECWYVNVCDEPNCEGCITYKSMLWQFEHCGLPKAKYKPISLYASKDDYIAFTDLALIREDIENFVRNGENLYICSTNTGTGKTSWAIKMLQTYFHYTAEGNMWNLKGMFVSVPKLLLQFKDFNHPLSQEYKDNLLNVDLLILDDIAVTGMSQYDYTQLFTLIDERMLSEKSIIFTSNNVTIDDLANVVGNRIASRVWNGSTIITLKGGDMRG